MSKITTSSVIIIGSSILMLFIGITLNIPYIHSIALFLLGLFLLVNGIQTLKNRRLGFDTTQKNFGPREIYTGISAQIWGILFVLLSIELLIIATIVVKNSSFNTIFLEQLLNHIETWGIIFLNIGGFAFTAGITRLISGSAGYYKGLADLIERIGGLVPLFAGIILLILGGLMVISPVIIETIWRDIITYFSHLLS